MLWKAHDQQRVAQCPAFTITTYPEQFTKNNGSPKSKKIKHKMTVLMLYGLLMFVFQFASRREVNREITRPLFEKNLNDFFPRTGHFTPCRYFISSVEKNDIEQLERIQIDVLNHLIRKKKFRCYLINNCYPVAIDGSQKLARKDLFTEELLQHKRRKIKTTKTNWKRRMNTNSLLEQIAIG